MSLTLSQLSDNFTGCGLIDNVYSNAKLTVDFISDLYTKNDSIFMSGVPELIAVTEFSDTELNRQAYTWLNETTSYLQALINTLIGTFNSLGIVSPPDYTDTPMIKLWLPMQVTLDTTYQININNNWLLIENSLNSSLSSLSPYLGGKDGD